MRFCSSSMVLSCLSFSLVSLRRLSRVLTSGSRDLAVGRARSVIDLYVKISSKLRTALPAWLALIPSSMTRVLVKPSLWLRMDVQTVALPSYILLPIKRSPSKYPRKASRPEGASANGSNSIWLALMISPLTDCSQSEPRSAKEPCSLSFAKPRLITV